MSSSKYHTIKELIGSVGEDVDKFYLKGNKTAGTRIRKTMQEIKVLAQEVRKDVQGKKVVK